MASSGIGSVLSHGAFSIHLALAFDAICARRTLRMAPADLVPSSWGSAVRPF